MSRKTTKDEAAKIADLTDAQIVSELDQITAQIADLVEQKADLRAKEAVLTTAQNDLERRASKLKGELLARTAPFKAGDIVADDQGVRYRVHRVYLNDGYMSNKRSVRVEAGQVWGIRLTKTGNEAYSTPRLIMSSRPLEKVDI